MINGLFCSLRLLKLSPDRVVFPTHFDFVFLNVPVQETWVETTSPRILLEYQAAQVLLEISTGILKLIHLNAIDFSRELEFGTGLLFAFFISFWFRSISMPCLLR